MEGNRLGANDSSPVILQLPVGCDIAHLPAPSAGDAGDLQPGGSIALGWSHPWGALGQLSPPDNSQEKGSAAKRKVVQSRER